MPTADAKALAAFPARDIAVTLTGAEWFALIAVMNRKPLSDAGRAALKTAEKKMTDQLTAESSRKVSP